jgi:hypothetical protein
MDEPIEHEYFNWLCAKVLQRGTRSYHDLLRLLHQTMFTWVVQQDRRRAADGVELRSYFLQETGFEKDRHWFDQPCSVFEAFVAFADRASFQTGDPLHTWFWEFMENLGLDQFRQVSDSDVPLIEETLIIFMERRYDENGYGGMFPLRQRPKRDQREVEIWYQFCDYLKDRGRM